MPIIAQGRSCKCPCFAAGESDACLWAHDGCFRNFLEKRVTEYSVNGMEGEWGWGENTPEGEVCGFDGQGCAA